MENQLAIEKITISHFKEDENLLPVDENWQSLGRKSKGLHKVLVVRVSDRWGHSPTYSAQQIAKHVFSGDLTMVRIFSFSNTKENI